MRTPRVLLTQPVSLAALTATALAQPLPPTEAIQLSLPGNDVFFPLTVSQCEPVFIWYNVPPSSPYSLVFLTPDRQPLVELFIPSGIGYLEWICDIPAGDGFIAKGYYEQYYVVQTGSSSSCLGNITTTYSIASYNTTLLQSYTEGPSYTASPSLDTELLPSATLSYPTGLFSTITVNPELAIASVMSTSYGSSSTLMGHSIAVPSPTASESHHARPSKEPAIVGGIVGGVLVLVILLTLGILACQTRRENVNRLDGAFTAVEHARQTTYALASSGSPDSRPTLGPSLSDPNTYMNTVYGKIANMPSAAHGSSLTIPTSMSSLPDAVNSVNRGGNWRTNEPPGLQPEPHQRTSLDSGSPSHLNSSQYDAAIEASTHATSTSVTAIERVPQAQLGPRAGGQNEPSNVVTALNALSQLNPDERRSLVTMLQSTVASST